MKKYKIQLLWIFVNFEKNTHHVQSLLHIHVQYEEILISHFWDLVPDTQMHTLTQTARASRHVLYFTEQFVLYYIKSFSLKEDLSIHIEHIMPHFTLCFDKKPVWRGWLIGQSHWGYNRWATTCDLKILGGLRWSLKGRRPSYDGLVNLRTGFCWPVTDRGHLYDYFNDFGRAPNTSPWPVGLLSVSNWLATGRRWFSLVCNQSFMVRDIGGKTGPWPVGNQSPTCRQPVAHKWATISTNWRDCKDLS